MQATIVFIGGGNMATSLIGGLIAAGHPTDRLRAIDPDPQRRRELASRYGIATAEAADADTLDADVWVLAVKPQVVSDAVAGLAAMVPKPAPLVVSVAAGVRIGALAEWFDAPVPLVRCMPNTPALIGAGATALYAGEDVDAGRRSLAESILATAGDTVWVDDESALDAVTATSGSGPAYFFAIMEAMQAGAERLGLPADTARRLVLQTALGAARLAAEGDDDPATLRRKVTSPGGTTEAALSVLEREGLADTVAQAMRAAAERSDQLADQLSRQS